MATKRIVIDIRESGADRTERSIKRVGKAASGAQRAVNGFRNVLVALAAVSAVKGLTEFVDTITRIDNRLNLLTGSQTLTNKLFNELSASAIRTRSSLEATVDLFSRLGRSTAELGLSQQQLLSLTESVNQAFQIYGNSATEASAATVQFAQGLAAGALRGDELRSVLEQAPRLAQAIADGLTEIEAFGPANRVVIGDLRELGKQGLLTADTITKALATQAETLEKEFGETTVTLVQAFTNLQTTFLSSLREFDQNTNASENLAQALAGLGDVIVGLFDAFNNILTFFNTQLRPGLETISNVLNDAGINLDNFATKAALAGAAVTLLFGPVGLIIAGLAAAAAEAGSLINATTALTDSSKLLIAELETENEASRILTEQLENNSIITVQQARQKLIEAEARIENTKRIKEEAEANKQALKEEIQGILARAALLDSQKLVSNAEFNFLAQGIAAIINTPANIELIELEGQVLAAAAALKALEEQGETAAISIDRDTEAIKRLKDELASGNLEDTTKPGASSSSSTSASEKAAEKARKALEQFRIELDRVDISAGNGSAAIDELNQLSDRLLSLFDRGLVTNKQRIALQEQINELIGQGEVQAVNDLISALDNEIELQKMSNVERELRNQLAREGLSIDEVDPAQISALRERLTTIEMTTEALKEQEKAEQRLKSLEKELSAGRDEVIQKQELLNELFDQGRINAEQFSDALEMTNLKLAELALQAGDGTLQDAFTVLLDQLRGDFESLQADLTDIFGQIGQSLTSNFGDAIADAIVDGEDFGEMLKSIARDALKQLISGLVQLGIQFLINQAIAKAGITASNALAASQGASLAAAYAPAAALASLATSGANSIPASAGITATAAVSQGVAALTPGFADGGLFRGMGTSRSDSNLVRVSDGEFIVNAQATSQNLDLLTAINSQGRSGAQQPINNTVNLNLPGVTDADSFRRSEKQIEKSLNRRLSR